MSTGTDWRKIADERLAKLAAIAKIGAEPPDQVLAIIAGNAPEPPVAGTGYHHSVDDFRRDLMADATAWHAMLSEYRKLMYDRGTPREEIPESAHDAHHASLMAWQYAYALAAVLKVAEIDFGPETARRLACVADDIGQNGDEDDLNADVAPGTPLPPPSPAELEAAGQLVIPGVLP